ncbi:hypothetical protein GOBAR_DD31631 [Gossypium barbadense]|nr:hypothetical protein GOBAR_DD31631 [Gossypium barbadense]
MIFKLELEKGRVLAQARKYLERTSIGRSSDTLDAWVRTKKKLETKVAYEASLPRGSEAIIVSKGHRYPDLSFSSTRAFYKRVYTLYVCSFTFKEHKPWLIAPKYYEINLSTSMVKKNVLTQTSKVKGYISRVIYMARLEYSRNRPGITFGFNRTHRRLREYLESSKTSPKVVVGVVRVFRRLGKEKDSPIRGSSLFRATVRMINKKVAQQMKNRSLRIVCHTSWSIYGKTFPGVKLLRVPEKNLVSRSDSGAWGESELQGHSYRAVLPELHVQRGA